VFNYLFANGDAHLKNFSLMESEQQDYLLAPAYDLLCTALHIDDADLALHGGLYEGDMDEPSYRAHGIYTRQSFMLFAEKTGINATIAKKIIDDSLKFIPPAMEMIDRSFLSKTAKEKYKNIVGERHRRFKT
jgi:serine/threonine-protein kinase HipA